MIEWNRELSPKVQNTLVGICLSFIGGLQLAQLNTLVRLLRTDGWDGVLRGADTCHSSRWLPYASVLLLASVIASGVYALAKKRAFSQAGLGCFHFILLLLSVNSVADVVFLCLDACHRVPIRPIGGELTIRFLLGFGTWIAWCVIAAQALGSKLKVPESKKAAQ